MSDQHLTETPNRQASRAHDRSRDAPAIAWRRPSHEEDPHFKSPTHWMVLALVIERPSYGYEINARFHRRFGAFTSVNASKIYDSLNKLGELGMIEVVDAPRDRRRRGQESMRRYFRATAHGAGAYRRWAAGQSKDGHKCADLLSRIATVGVLGPQAILHVIDRFERECLRSAQSMELPPIDGERGDPGPAGIGGITGLADLLVSEQQRFALEAELAWAAYAKRQILAYQAQVEGSRRDAGGSRRDPGD